MNTPLQSSTAPTPSTMPCPAATLAPMRDKELRLALVCYGGISLAVYMHGVTKEVWHLARASQIFHTGKGDQTSPYAALLRHIRDRSGMTLRILPDIIAGASAGGINGIFLAHAIASGQSLEPLTDLWLGNADVEKLLDPAAKPGSSMTKFWATPIAWAALRGKDNAIDATVGEEARSEVRRKLTAFVRSRWFEPPFGGDGFTSMLLDAFEEMAAKDRGERLLPPGQPLDLFVTVTDFNGFPVPLRIHSPPTCVENEHRVTLSFRDGGCEGYLADPAELVYAARATASFPGAFPPFHVAEIDRVLAERKREWPNRSAFLARSLPGHAQPEQAILIDGSVLANAPFEPAIQALKDRPARREIDRRFVYIDPKPGRKAVKLTKAGGDNALPGFVSTIFGAMSDIPREQPIRDSLESIDDRSARIRRMQRIIEALRPNVEKTIEGLFGMTFFLDKPTPARLDSWREKALTGATKDAGFAYSAYAHVKLSGIVEEIAALAVRHHPEVRDSAYEGLRQSLWAEVRARNADSVWTPAKGGAQPDAIAFFRQHDLGYRIRRLRFVIRNVSALLDSGTVEEEAVSAIRTALFKLLAAYLDREAADFYHDLSIDSAADLIDAIARQRGLSELDQQTDAELAAAFSDCPKDQRRTVLYAYLGFPYYDISTLPLLQGEGLDEFDPIKVDRISPEDAVAIRGGGVAATLKGIEFNSFGAFFSRAYRENDYLWGRLHGADRLFDIVCSSTDLGDPAGDAQLRALKEGLLLAILDEEEARLKTVPDLFRTIRREIAEGPLSA
jgi:patatin-related protein